MDEFAAPRHRARCRRRRPWLLRRPRRVIGLLAGVLALVLVLPVPWLHVVSDDPPGTAWRLDGRLEVNGVTVDPPGRWTWLAVGRPQLVGEALYERVFGSDHPPTDLRSGPVVQRPGLSEPSAAAVGLRHAGRDIELGLLVEARDPLLAELPQSAVVTSVNGIPLTSRQAWERATSGWDGADGAPAAPDGGTDALEAEVTFSLRDGRQFTAPGPGLPYARVTTLDVAPDDLEAGIAFQVARYLPADWFRELSLGRSHGMMVALTTYAQASGQDLAQGRHIAGTGAIRGDGSVTGVSGLPAKARAANRAGADVLLVPAWQAYQVDDLELPGTMVVPVESLDEAIEWLVAPTA